MNPVILLGGGILLLVLLIVGAVVTVISDRSLVEERLGQFLEDDKPRVEEASRGAAMTDWLNRRVANLPGATGSPVSWRARISSSRYLNITR